MQNHFYENDLVLHENETACRTHFHVAGFAPRLLLKQRQKRTREWHIEWSPLRSVIIRVITKSDDRATGVRSVNHEYDYRPNWRKGSLNRKNYNFREKKNSQVMKERKNLH